MRKKYRKYTDEKTFAQVLKAHIDTKGKKNSYWYTRAGITASVFSTMGIDGVTPDFENVIKIALAINLTLEETLDLLSRLRYTLSPSYVLDSVVKEFLEKPKYFIHNHTEYDLEEVDYRLVEKGEKPLFSEM